MLLSIDDIYVRYGGLTAVRGVSLRVGEGEVVCVIGPNGAGKSSTLQAIAGAVPLASGRIRFDGQDIAGLKPESIARRGFSLVPEGRRIFASLTVDENLRLGTGMRRDRRALASDLGRVLDYFPALAERRYRPAGLLSGGEQQMLAIGRALLTRPRLIAVDEPSLGLAPIMIDEVYRILVELNRRDGMTLLIVEQSIERALQVADRIFVLRSGQVALSGPPEEMADRLRVETAYFGVA